MPIFKSKEANSAIIGIYSLLLTVFILSALYLGQYILIPITIAILLTFILKPLVAKLEQWLGRILSVLTVVTIIFIGASFLGYILTSEFIDLTSKLPNYKGNIENKIQSITSSESSILPIWNKFYNFENNLQINPKKQNSTVKENQTGDYTTKSDTSVKVVETNDIKQTAQIFIHSLLTVIWNIGLVMLLVVFMLVNREDLKGKIIRLIGQGNISATTIAMDDAGSRISHYLLMQLLINLSFGIILSIGLYFIDIPNAALWGGLLSILRFIPYIGTWIAAGIPILLSFITSSNWITPLETIFLYLFLDLICTNVIEPLLYGASTGVSSTALIIAAVFWTLLWGPIGLLLAVPLTVCLVVMGRHIPELEALNILLSDEKPLEIHEEFFHLLLAESPNKAAAFVDNYLKDKSLVSFYDNVLIPVLMHIEKDMKRETLDSEKAENLYEGFQEIIEYLKIITSNIDNLPTSSNATILCLPAHAFRDELVGMMLNQILEKKFNISNISCEMTINQILDLVEKQNPDIIFIFAVSPSTMIHARYLCNKLRTYKYKKKIIIGIWKENIDINHIDRLSKLGADTIVSSLKDTLVEITNIQNESK